MIFYLTSITLPPSPEFLQLRIYQRGGKEWITVKYPGVGESVKVDFPFEGEPVLILWAIQGEIVQSSPGVKGWSTVGTRGFAEIDLVQGTEKTFSILDPAANYMDYGTKLKITIPKGSSLGPVAPIEELLASAEEERQDQNAITQQGDALAPVISIMFLRRFRSISGVLPASYFCMVGFRDAPPAEDMVSQMLKNASLLHGWSYESILEMLRMFRSDSALPQAPKLLEILGDMLVLPATANFYHGDHSLERTVDRFQSSIYQDLGQGDCEDVSKDVHYFGTSIQKLDPNRGPLRDLVWLLQQYVFMMITGVATSPKLQRPGTVDHGENKGDYICHVWTMAVPKQMVSEWKGQSFQRSEHMDRLVDIGALVLEGTNFTTALHRPLPSYYPKEVAEEMAKDKWRKAAIRMELDAELKSLPYPLPAIPTLQEPILPSDQSRFYRYVVSAWTHPEKDTDPLEHTFIKDGKVGVSIQDFLALPSGITMRPNFQRRLTNRGVMSLLAAEPPQQPLIARPMADLPSLHAVPFDAPLESREKFPYLTPWLTFRLQNQNELTAGAALALRVFRRKYPGSRVTVTILPITQSFSILEIHLYLSDKVAAGPANISHAKELAP